MINQRWKRTMMAGASLSMAASMMCCTLSTTALAAKRKRVKVQPATVGISELTPTFANFVYAEQHNLCRPDGIRLKLVTLHASVGPSALLSGSIDALIGGGANLVAAAKTGQLMNIAFNGGAQGVIAAGNGITTLSQLDGKTFGTTTPTGGTALISALIFKKYHISVQTNYLGSASTAVDALGTGKVDGGALELPLHSSAEHVLITFKAAGLNVLLGNFTTVKKSLIKAKPSFVHDLLACEQTLNEYARSHQKQIVNVIVNTEHEYTTRSAGATAYHDDLGAYISHPVSKDVINMFWKDIVVPNYPEAGKINPRSMVDNSLFRAPRSGGK